MIWKDAASSTVGVTWNSVNKLEEKTNICVIYYVLKWMKTILLTVSSFPSTCCCFHDFFFCVCFCLLSHSKIIRCTAKSLITTSTCFLLKCKWKKNLKVFFGRQSLGAPTGIPVSQTTWIRHWSVSFWHCSKGWDIANITQLSLNDLWFFSVSSVYRHRFLFTEKLNFYETNQCSIS